MKSRNFYYHHRKVMPRVEPSKSIDFNRINYDYSGNENNKDYKINFKNESYRLYNQLDDEISSAMTMGLLAVVLIKKLANKRRDN